MTITSVAVRALGWGTTLVALVAASCVTLPDLIDGSGAGGGGSSDGGAGDGGALGGGSSDGGAGGGGALPVCSSTTSSPCANLVDVSLGDQHSCALASDGYVRCWGSNLHGQLGDPELSGLSHHLPRVVPTISGVDQLAAGRRHVCARTGTDVYCWGSNELSTLGADGATELSAQPLRVDLPPVAQLAVGMQANCATLVDGQVMCWGKSLSGQAWNGTDNDPVPGLVMGLDGMSVAEVHIGDTVACAVSEDGLDVRCWGEGGTGCLGDGTTMGRAHAASVAPSLETPLTSISVGAVRVCSIGGAPSTLQCWGVFDNNATQYDQPSTLPAFSATGYDDQVGGWAYWLLLDDFGTATAFGFNFFGILGPNAGGAVWVTEPVVVETGVLEIYGGWEHACARLATGELRCWGKNHRGQAVPGLGDLEVRRPSVVDLD